MNALHQDHSNQTGWLRKDKMKFSISTNCLATKSASLNHVFFPKNPSFGREIWIYSVHLPNPKCGVFFRLSNFGQGSIRKFSGKPREICIWQLFMGKCVKHFSNHNSIIMSHLPCTFKIIKYHNSHMIQNMIHIIKIQIVLKKFPVHCHWRSI